MLGYVALAVLSYIAWLIVLLPLHHRWFGETITRREIWVTGFLVALVVTFSIMSKGN